MNTAEPGAARETNAAARARRLHSLILAEAPAIDRERQLTKTVVDALHENRMFRMLMPRSLGGDEGDLVTMAEAIETIASADGSTAWCLGQGIGCTIAGGFLEKGLASKIYSDPRAVLAWGPVAPGFPKPLAIAVEGGYRVTGTWRFASGSGHATWLGGVAPIQLPDGSVIGPRTFFFRKEEATMTDIWQVMGLRGTASNQYAVHDFFVPENMTWDRKGGTILPIEPNPLYKVPAHDVYGIAFASVALGLARGMLDAFIDLAGLKGHNANLRGLVDAKSKLRENSGIQRDVALMEGRWRASRAFLHQATREAIDSIAEAGTFLDDPRTNLRLAATFAIHEAKDVAGIAFQRAGSNAVFDNNPFERRFRDINTVAQQGQGRIDLFEHVGQAVLGLPPEHYQVA